MKHILYMLALTTVLVACGNNSAEGGGAKGRKFQKKCEKAIAACTQLEKSVDELYKDPSYKRICEVQKLSDELTFTYNANALDSVQLARAKEVDQKIADLKASTAQQIEQIVKQGYWKIVNLPETLLVQKTEFPVYIERGEKLFVNISTEKPADIRIYNINSQHLLRSYIGKSNIEDSIEIAFSSIYLVEINPHTRQYASIGLTFHPNNIDRIAHPKQISSQQVEGKKGDFRVQTIKGIKMKKLFEEPRKFTLRSQLKAQFSGSYRAVVSVPVPKGATDILYSLRISTNEPSRSSDGKFHDNMETSYKRVRVLGLPVYESHSGAGIISTILGENTPTREEDAYINMYVFYDAAQARKFQDNADPANLKYNIDYSTMGTQSCNGRIPAKGHKTIYLGFLNERVRYNNYVWLEAVSAVPNTEYIKTEYKIK